METHFDVSLARSRRLAAAGDPVRVCEHDVRRGRRPGSERHLPLRGRGAERATPLELDADGCRDDLGRCRTALGSGRRDRLGGTRPLQRQGQQHGTGRRFDGPRDRFPDGGGRSVLGFHVGLPRGSGWAGGVRPRGHRSGRFGLVHDRCRDRCDEADLAHLRRRRARYRRPEAAGRHGRDRASPWPARGAVPSRGFRS